MTGKRIDALFSLDIAFPSHFFLSITASTRDVTMGGNTFKVCTTSLCNDVKCGDVPGDPTPCHCDFACEFYNDCCGDFESICSAMESAESTRGFYETVDALEQVDLACISPNPGAVDAYWMIQSCPDTWKGDVVRYKCTSREPSSNTDLVLLPMVHGGVTYRNVFCAVCNGIELNHGNDSITGWKFEFNCSKEYATRVELRNVTLHELINSANCEPRFSPPTDVPKSSLRACPNNNYVASCPTDAPQILREGCMSFSSVYTDDSTGELYKNPYCQLCNEGAVSKNWTINEHNEYVERICSSPEQSLTPVIEVSGKSFDFEFGFVDESFIDKDTDSGSLTPISVIIDFSGKSGVSIFYSENIVVKRQVTCNDGEVFDLTSDGCVAVTCADGYTLTDGRCVRDSPSFNLTCGKEGADLELSLTAVILTEINETHLQSDIDQLDRLTNCIATSLLLSNDSFIFNDKISLGNSTNYFGSNSDHTNIPPEGHMYISVEYRVDATTITYAELEDSIDRSLLHVYQSSLGCSIQKVEISQRCIAIEGLYKCQDGHEELLDPSFQTFNGTSFVYDNETGDLYHPYETELVASYSRQDSLPFQSFHKNEVVRICDRGNVLSCPLITRNASLFTTVTGKALFLRDRKTEDVIGPDEYMLTSDGNIQVCVPVGSGQNGTVNDTVVKNFFRYDQSQIILSYFGVCLSLLALIITFLTYSTFPVLRQCVSNKLIMILCVALFAAQLFQLLNGLATGDEETCMIVAVVGHFLWLLVFAMTTVLAIELDRTFGSLNNFTVSSDSLISLLKYSAFAFTLSGAIVGTCVAIHFTIGDEINFQYGSETLCWIGDRTVNLIAFGGPLAVFLFVNTILFAHTVHGIRHVTKVRNRAIRHASTLKERGKELRIYWKVYVTIIYLSWHQVCKIVWRRQIFKKVPEISLCIIEPFH